MNKEFIPYQQALELKELGFDKPCFAKYYQQDGNTPFIQIGESEIEEAESAGDDVTFECEAPLYQQAFRWFREKYFLQDKIWSGKTRTVFYGYDILNIEEQEFVINNSENGGGDCDYDTYEEAELECLIKLIEIIKTK